LGSAREIARKAKIAKTNDKNALAIERVESIQLSLIEYITIVVMMRKRQTQTT
jgi:hypothetical protein